MTIRSYVFDTNVYVKALREGEGATLTQLMEVAPRTYLPVVVSAELHAGARDEAGRRAVVALARRFERVRRLVVPTAASWNEAGHILATIARREPEHRSKIKTLWNDTL